MTCTSNTLDINSSGTVMTNIVAFYFPIIIPSTMVSLGYPYPSWVPPRYPRWCFTTKEVLLRQY